MARDLAGKIVLPPHKMPIKLGLQSTIIPKMTQMFGIQGRLKTPSLRMWPLVARASKRRRVTGGQFGFKIPGLGPHGRSLRRLVLWRSEERRVGKDGVELRAGSNSM